SGTGIPAGNLAFALGGVSGTPDNCGGWVDGGLPLPLQAWSHVVVEFDGSAVRTYVNGVLGRTVPASGTVATSSGALRIGGRSNANSSFFAGQIDEVGIYNRPLSSGEVRGNFTAGSLHRAPTGVMTDRLVNEADLITDP